MGSVTRKFHSTNQIGHGAPGTTTDGFCPKSSNVRFFLCVTASSSTGVGSSRVSNRTGADACGCRMSSVSSPFQDKYNNYCRPW